MTMYVRPLALGDSGPVSEILHHAFAAGDTYAVPAGMDPVACLEWWTVPGKTVWVMVEGDVILGTYYIRANGEGPGAHICNCGYVTAPEARGRGVASAMLAHSLGEARRNGYRGMQYNAVVSTNEGAIRLWQRGGFTTIGRVPGAFHHPQLGYVDTLIMYLPLVDDPYA